MHVTKSLVIDNRKNYMITDCTYTHTYTQLYLLSPIRLHGVVLS